MLRSSTSSNRPPPIGFSPPQFMDWRNKYYENEYAKLVARQTQGGQKCTFDPLPMYFFDPESEQAKQPMSYEEKAALSQAIGKLPADRIQGFQIKNS